MSALHAQRDCWCKEDHDFAEAVLKNFDHLNTVRQAEVLAPYELEAASSCDVTWGSKPSEHPGFPHRCCNPDASHYTDHECMFCPAVLPQ